MSCIWPLAPQLACLSAPNIQSRQIIVQQIYTPDSNNNPILSQTRFYETDGVTEINPMPLGYSISYGLCPIVNVSNRIIMGQVLFGPTSYVIPNNVTAWSVYCLKGVAVTTSQPVSGSVVELNGSGYTNYPLFEGSGVQQDEFLDNSVITGVTVSVPSGQVVEIGYRI